MIDHLKERARALKRDAHAVYLAARDPRVPWHAKALALGVAGYALSPLDLIPDFIPVVGHLDDLIIVPLGIMAVVKLVPVWVLVDGDTPVRGGDVRIYTGDLHAGSAPGPRAVRRVVRARDRDRCQAGLPISQGS